MAGNRRWLGTIGFVLSTVFFGLMANWISNEFHLPGSASVVLAATGITAGLILAIQELPVLFHRSTVVVNGWSASRRTALICTISDRSGASDELIPVIVEQLKKRGAITCLGLIGTAETQAGGTAVMTLGAYLAAQEAGIDVEYVATPRTIGQRADMYGRHPVIVSRGRRGTVQSRQEAVRGQK